MAVFVLSGLLFAAAVWKLDKAGSAEIAELRGRLSQAGQEKVETSAGARGLEAVRPAARAAGDAIAAAQARVLRASQDPALTGLLHPTAPKPRRGRRAKPAAVADPAKAFEAFAASGRDLWGGGLTVLDGQGKVAGSWPEKSDGKDSARAFRLLHLQGDAAGQVYLFGETFDSRLKKMVSLVIVGLPGGGMLEARVPVKGMLEASLSPSLKNLSAFSPHSTFYVLRGSGKAAFAAPAEAENTEAVLSALFTRPVLSKMTEAENGWIPSTRSGLKGLVVWNRVFPWEPGQGLESLQVAAAFLPWADFESSRSSAPPARSSHFLVWLLVAVAVLVPLFLAGALIGKALEPLVQSAEAVQGLQSGRMEIGFPETKAWEIQELQKGIQTLIDRVRGEGTRQYRDESNEDRGMREALEKSGMELSNERDRAAGLAAQSAELAAKVSALENALQASQQEAEAQGRAARADSRKLEARLLEQEEALRAGERALREASDKPPQVIERVVEVAAAERPSLPQSGVPEKIRLEATQALSVELKSTLGVIKNYVSTMLGESGTISGPQQEFLGVVINKSARLERLVNDLQDLAQINVKAPLLMGGDLPGLVQGLVMNAQAQAENKNVSLEFTAEPDLPEVAFNPEKMSQAVNTLLTQAIKVTPAEGRVAVDLRRVPAGLEVSVGDSGMDLGPDKAARVFTDFHGIDTQAGPEFIGSGLRFTILQAIAEAHGGSVRLQTGTGAGKAFVLQLPLSAPGAAVQAPAPAPLPPLKPAGLLELLKKPAAALPPLPSVAAPTPAAAGGLSAEEVAHFSNVFSEPSPASSASPSAPPPPAQAPKEDLSKDEFANFASIFAEPSAGSGQVAPPPPVKPAPVASPTPQESGLPPRPEVSLAKEDMENFASIFGGTPPPPGPPPAPVSAPAPVIEIQAPPAPKVKGLGSLDDLTQQIKQADAAPPKRAPKGGL